MHEIFIRGWLTLFIGCSAGTVAAAPYRFPIYADAAAVTTVCDETLAALKAGERKLEGMKRVPARKLLAAYDGLNLLVDDKLGPLDLMAYVHPDKAIRDAAEACTLKVEAWSNAFLQNERVYGLVKAAKPIDDIDRGYRLRLLEGYEDAGVTLPRDKRERAQALLNEITQQAQTFSRNIREDKTKVPFTDAELQGVPENVWKNAPRDDAGRVLLGLEYPASIPVLQQAKQEAARERMYLAYNRKGGEHNLPILTKVLDLRREYAALFGHESFADFTLRRRMAGDEATVQKFLASVKDAVAARELSDIELLRRTKADETGVAFDTVRINRWDTSYYIERTRAAKYQLDKEQFRAYFPPEASLDFVFRIATRLYGITFAPVSTTLWHADARAFEVKDAKSGRTIGTLFVDLYPRPDKYTHAAVWGFRGRSTLTGRQPAAALVVNFNRQGLNIDELETLLHEFGHAMHVILSDTRYSEQSGTRVKRDFVEAPSQMLEDWVYDDRVIALFKEVCSSCKPVPAELLAKARDARYFARGITFARQHLYASYDLSLYGRERREPLAEWARMEGATPLGTVSGTMFPAAFDHIVQGYAAGYYSYLWSLVLAEDLRTAFAGKLLDAATGDRYRRTVLANGGQLPPAQLMQRFLGRHSNSQAFFTSLDRR